MEWVQFITILATIVGGGWSIWRSAKENINRLDDHHREDMKLMDDKWERLFTRMDDKIELMRGQK